MGVEKIASAKEGIVYYNAGAVASLLMHSSSLQGLF